jgi:hypothetical protein
MIVHTGGADTCYQAPVSLTTRDTTPALGGRNTRPQAGIEHAACPVTLVRGLRVW